MNQNRGWGQMFARLLGLLVAGSMLVGALAFGTGLGIAGAHGNSNEAFVYVYPRDIFAPRIVGPTVAGQTVSVEFGFWRHHPTSFSEQWLLCGRSARSSCTLIGAATKQQYTLTSADVGHRLRVQVTARNNYGPGAPVLSRPSRVVTAAVLASRHHWTREHARPRRKAARRRRRQHADSLRRLHRRR